MPAVNIMSGHLMNVLLITNWVITASSYFTLVETETISPKKDKHKTTIHNN